MFEPFPYRRVDPAAPLFAERWDADAHVHALAGGPGWTTLGALAGRFVEGVRAPQGPTYRPSDLDHLSVSPTLEHRTDPVDREAVGPGDVLLTKLFPVRTALVTGAVPRLPVDANCARIIGLPPGAGLWVAALLVHPGFAPSLAQVSAGRALPRVGVRDLAALAIPQPPVDVGALAEPWIQAADQRLDATREIRDLRLAVQELADDAAPFLPPDARTPRFVPAAHLPDAWLPDHVARAEYALALAERRWPALGDVLAPEPERLRQHLPPIRLLRLSNAGDDLHFEVPAPEPPPDPVFRVYGRPFAAEEILISTLGSAPKVLFHHPVSESTVWLSDVWARVLPTPFPGALALALLTRQVEWQLHRAATGVVRQYVARDDLAQVRLPPIDPELAARLHERLCSALERRSSAERRMSDLRSRLDTRISAALGGAR